MTQIYINTATIAEMHELLAGFAKAGQSNQLTAIAQSIAQARNEQSAQLDQMRHKLSQIMITIDQILENVQAQRTTVESVSTFIVGLEQRLTEAVAGADPETQAKMQSIVDELNSQKQALADAIDNDPGTPAQPSA